MGLFEVIDAWDLVLFLKVTFFFGLGVVFFFLWRKYGFFRWIGVSCSKHVIPQL
jgi:hypothetical protein